jgi:hypothetical protein
MAEISSFIFTKITDDRHIQLTGTLFQLYYFEEELTNCEREIQDLSKQLADLSPFN